MWNKLITTVALLMLHFFAQGQNNQYSPLGINLGSVTSWDQGIVFVDAMKCSREWISQCNGCSFGSGTTLPTDSLGWVTNLPPNHWATTVMLDEVIGKPTGIYNLYYEGEGTFDFKGDVVDTTHVSNGHILIEVGEGTGGIWLEIWTTDPNGTGNYLRNIRLVMPGFENSYENQPFYPALLDTWANFSCLRFMDWNRTNGSNVQTWNDRTRTNGQTQGGANGVAPEYMVQLANTLQADAWICIPHQADDNYIIALATLFRDSLDPNLTLYIEYSNEVWNGLFSQANYASAQGLAQGLSTNSYEAQAYFHAKRSVEIFNIFQNTFGGLSRLKRVVAWQNFNTSWSQQILDYNNTYQHTDAFAIAPYFGGFLGNPTTADSIGNMSVDSVLMWCEDALADVMEGCRLQAEIAKSRGVSLIAYEGGQHLSGYSGAENNNSLTAKLIAVNRSDKMQALYHEYYERWKAAGGELFAVFSSMGKYSKWGSWGILENYTQDRWTTPKYAATEQFIAANSPAWWNNSTTTNTLTGDLLIDFDGDILPTLTVTQNRNFTTNANNRIIPFSIANGDNLFTTGDNQSEFYGGIQFDYKNNVVGGYNYHLSNYGSNDLFIADLYAGSNEASNLTLLFLWRKDQFLNNYALANEVSLGKLSVNILNNKNSAAGSDFRFIILQNGQYYISDFMTYQNGLYELELFNNSEIPAKRWYHYTPTALDFSVPAPLTSPFAMTFDAVEAVGFMVDNYRTGYGATFAFDKFQAYTKTNSEFTVTINQADTQTEPTTTEPIIYKAIFSEATSDFTASDVTISGSATNNSTTATVTEIAPFDGTTYQISVANLAQNGFIIATIDSLKATNATGNTNFHSTSKDNIVAFKGANRPTVTLHQSATQADPTLNTPILFTAIFSEAITGFDANDITLNGTANPTTATITEIAPNDGTTFQIAVSGMSADGLVVVELAENKVFTPLYHQGNEASNNIDNTVEFIYNIPTNGQLIDFQGANVPQNDFLYHRTPQLSANNLSKIISFSTADGDQLFTSESYNQVEIYGGVQYSFQNIGTSTNHEMRRNDTGFAPNQFWCQVAGGDGEQTNIELFYLWRKDQFLNNLHLFNIGFDNNPANSSLTINILGKRENLDLRFVIKDNDTYYMSEFSANTVGLITLTEFNNAAIVGKRWGIITPTANDFSIPTPLPTFQAVNFTNVTAIGFICSSPRSTYSNFLTFDGFTANGITIASTPLPVELLDFKANCLENGQVELSWQTASEQNNSHFEIEINRNGFEKIGSVNGNGWATDISNYIFIDENIIENLKTLYYRLKQVDFDGNFEYSKTIAVDCWNENSNDDDFQIYPNPVADELTAVTKPVRFEVQIYDVLGHLILSQYFDNQEIITLNLNNLQSGIYFIKIGNVTKRFVKG